ncbi:MAG: nucleotidyltransferase family protein [Candidatus Daviesbacteria bacterium]|nr:nucleotidyltransferase family protein [Candidatus Daviesbacteria bacterium]
MVKTAIILAGGKGERLRPYTNDRPKPMVEINGKPILAYQLEQLKKAGITEVVFACSYRREALQKHLSSGNKYGIKASFSVEETPLGRGGGIKKAMQMLSSGWENVVITNGDNLWKLDIQGLIKKHNERSAIATIVVVPLKSPYGIVEFNDSDEILGFKEKPILPHWVNAGVYVFSKEVELLLPDEGDHEIETFPKLPTERFLVFKSTDYWRGVDTVKDLTEAEKEVAEIFNG